MLIQYWGTWQICTSKLSTLSCSLRVNKACYADLFLNVYWNESQVMYFNCRPERETITVHTEGCFCPEGTLLFNKESGFCVNKCGKKPVIQVCVRALGIQIEMYIKKCAFLHHPACLGYFLKFSPLFIFRMPGRLWDTTWGVAVFKILIMIFHFIFLKCINCRMYDILSEKMNPRWRVIEPERELWLKFILIIYSVLKSIHKIVHLYLYQYSCVLCIFRLIR